MTNVCLISMYTFINTAGKKPSVKQGHFINFQQFPHLLKTKNQFTLHMAGMGNFRLLPKSLLVNLYFTLLY